MAAERGWCRAKAATQRFHHLLFYLFPNSHHSLSQAFSISLPFSAAGGRGHMRKTHAQPEVLESDTDS